MIRLTSKEQGDFYFGQRNYVEAARQYKICKESTQRPQEKEMYETLEVGSYTRMDKYESLFDFIRDNIDDVEERSKLIADIGYECLRAAYEAFRNSDYKKTLQVCNRLLSMQTRYINRLPADLELKLILIKRHVCIQKKIEMGTIVMDSRRIRQLTSHAQFELNLDNVVTCMRQNKIALAKTEARICATLLVTNPYMNIEEERKQWFYGLLHFLFKSSLTTSGGAFP